MPKIKICGLRRLEDIEIVNRYNPDYIGFVFAESPRKVTHDLAGQMKDKLNENIESVGVFVNAEIEEITELYESGIIEMAQLHGGESEEYIKKLKEKTNNEMKLIKAIEIKSDMDVITDTHADFLLFDSGKGSGETFDWSLIKNKINKKFFIAGGLDKNNIKQAIDTFNPYGLDLSSSLEVDNVKDENRIREIMEVIN